MRAEEQQEADRGDLRRKAEGERCLGSSQLSPCVEARSGSAPFPPSTPPPPPPPMPPPQPRTVSPPCAARARRGLSGETPPFRVSAFLLVSLFFFLLCPAAVPATAARPQEQRMGRVVEHHAGDSGGLHASSAAAIGVDHKDSSHSHNHPIEHSRPSAKPASRQLALMPGIAKLYALGPRGRLHRVAVWRP